MFPFAWMIWLDTVEGKRGRESSMGVGDDGRIGYRTDCEPSSEPDPGLFAAGLRAFAASGETVPPALLSRIADMFDPPKAHKGATAKLTRPKGGKAPTYDWIEIGRRTEQQLAEAGRGKWADTVHKVAIEFGCSETIVKDALRQWRQREPATND